MDTKRIIVRGDDGGSCLSANRACLKAAREGIVRNLSVMVPGPSFEALAPELAQLDGIAIGLHVVLNAEWDNVKWGPVSGAAAVPSLVDDDGHFLPTPMHLHERGLNLDEAEREVRAQLERGRELGVTFHYMDEHMGVGWVMGLRDRLESIAAEYGLLKPSGEIGLHEVEGAVPDEPVERFLESIRQAEPGTYLAVFHPGLNEPDMQQFGHVGLEPGQVARERGVETELLTDLRVLEAVRDGLFTPIRYLDA